MDRHSFARVLFALVWGAFCHTTALALEGRIELQETELVVKLEDGRELRRDDLIGLTLVLGGGQQDVEVRIDGFEEDRSILGDPLALYRLSVRQPDGGSVELCKPDPDRRRAAFAFPDGKGGFNLTCTSGAEGKCILFGYRSWQKRSNAPMSDLLKACIHMLRADYGGDSHPWTKDGTAVNLYDRFDIQKPGKAIGMAFEAAWGPDGAICVAHPRIADNVTLEELGARYPHLKGRLGPQACTEAAMRADPRALIFNESAVTQRASK